MIFVSNDELIAAGCSTTKKGAKEYLDDDWSAVEKVDGGFVFFEYADEYNTWRTQK